MGYPCNGDKYGQGVSPQSHGCVPYKALVGPSALAGGFGAGEVASSTGSNTASVPILPNGGHGYYMASPRRMHQPGHHNSEACCGRNDSCGSCAAYAEDITALSILARSFPSDCGGSVASPSGLRPAGRSEGGDCSECVVWMFSAQLAGWVGG